METQKDDKGLQTFLEHWWFLLMVVVAILASQVLDFFMRLCGTPWIFFRGEFRAHDFWRRFDWLREVSSLSERPVFHVRSEVGAGAFEEILSLGLARIFIRCRAFTLFIFVEAMSQRFNTALGPTPTADWFFRPSLDF
jgi:hypothetical protein